MLIIKIALSAGSSRGPRVRRGRPAFVRPSRRRGVTGRGRLSKTYEKRKKEQYENSIPVQPMCVPENSVPANPR